MKDSQTKKALKNVITMAKRRRVQSLLDDEEKQQEPQGGEGKNKRINQIIEKVVSSAGKN